MKRRKNILSASTIFLTCICFYFLFLFYRLSSVDFIISKTPS